MKQVLLRKGRISVEDVPAPALNPKSVLVEVQYSLISTGTEMSSVNLSGASLLEKAKQKPEAVAKVLQSVRVRGIKKTWALVEQELDQSRPLGYSCMGRVLAVGADVNQFQIGDRVACAGAQLANHAEVVSVPSLLTVKVPVGVGDPNAAFVTVGAIALQGVRRADVRLGESVLVIGLGLIGQLTVQLLAASGCRVYGLDVSADRVERAKQFGLRFGGTSFAELNEKIQSDTDHKGADATLITASTSSSDPANDAFAATRKKGRVIVVGAIGMNLNRSPFYEKEQDFLISCSYGPGRYDESYEQYGQDYPYAYVRWTENRNMAAFLDLIDQKKLDINALRDKEYALADAPQAYEDLASAMPPPLAALLRYPAEDSMTKIKKVAVGPLPPRQPGQVRLGLIGIGNFLKTTHLPNLKSMPERVSIVGVCSGQGAAAQTLSRQLNAPLVSSDPEAFLSDPQIEAVLITTRHGNHAKLAKMALQKGKHVFLEKPLALTRTDLDDLDRTVRSMSTPPVFMVGFNRRYAQLASALKDAVSQRQSPLTIFYRVNAGKLPPQHWVYTTEGGGRLRGEGCHMVDFFRFLVGHPLTAMSIEALSSPVSAVRPDDNFSASFSYEDGSMATLLYTSQGSSDMSKEFIEVHWDGVSAQLNDFKSLEFFGRTGDQSGRADKGHRIALETFLKAVKSGLPFPIPWEQLAETTGACIQLDDDIWGRLA